MIPTNDNLTATQARHYADFYADAAETFGPLELYLPAIMGGPLGPGSPEVIGKPPASYNDPRAGSHYRNPRALGLYDFPSGAHMVEPRPAWPERIGDFMQTYSGRKFWPLDPRADEIHIEDIAHSLALQSRYAGHCERFYSVAEHCVHIARWLPTDKLWGLLHDAAEAYTVDVPRPLKRSLVGYAEAEAKVMAAVCDRFGLPVEMPLGVHEADMRIIADEVAQNMRPMDWHAKHNDPLGVVLQFWTPEEAEDRFLEMFVELTMQKGRMAA